MARNGGVGGFANAAIHAAVVSCGPWVLTVVAVLMLQLWTTGHSDLATRTTVQTIMVYAFSASVVIAAPFALVGVRLASDLLFAHRDDALPGVLVTMLNWSTTAALLVGYALFGLAARLPPHVALLATAIVILLTQVAVTGPFLTAARRHGPILLGYTAGIVVAGLGIVFLMVNQTVGILLTVTGALALTELLLLAVIRRDYPDPVADSLPCPADLAPVLHVGAAGLANALALWIDKWLLWWAPGSAQQLGYLRVNPVYDPASFLGLLSLIPGLAVILVLSETRLERAFSHLTRNCTGTAKLSRIREARDEVAGTVLRQLRTLVALQMVMATVCWVMAPEIFRVLGYDPRGIFAFRFTVIGVVFHIVAIYTTIVLSYYDLFGRIVMVWSVFVLASAAGTLACWNLGFAGYGWGYMAGTLAAAITGLALLGNATSQLVYLLFVGNNPSVAGQTRFWI